MSLQVNSGGVTANIVSTAATNKTVTLLYAAPSNETITMGTVPANKIWRIVYVSINALGWGSAFSATPLVTIGGDVVARIATSGLASDISPFASQVAQFEYSCCPVLTAGETVTTTSNSTVPYVFTIVGYVEESV